MADTRLERKLDCLIADLDLDGLVFAKSSTSAVRTTKQSMSKWKMEALSLSF